MTQAVVNFVTSLVPVAGSTLPVQSRVFDFEISQNAQTYYSYNMGQIQSVFDTINAGGTPTLAEEKQFIASLHALNQWSGMKYIDANGVLQPSGTPVFYDSIPNPPNTLPTPSAYTI